MQDTDNSAAPPPHDAVEGVVEAAPTVESLAFAQGAPFGSGLKAAREFLGLSLQDVADITKIRKAYLAALETMAIDQLPSRPFAIGYVRAYARALGIDEDQAIVRFKEDAPDKAEPLRAPVGVAKERDPRLALLLIAGAIVLAAIVIWNVAQRAMRNHDVPSVMVAAAPAPAAPASTEPAGPVELGQALPPPVEASIPEPYVTPGLPGAAPTTADAPTGPRQLGAKAQIYGASPNEASAVTLQAARSVTMVIKTADGKPFFAKQLLAGESFRAPNVPGLSVDVSSPEAVDVFVGGEYKGVLSAPVTSLSALMR
jgi:cytoskeleton protein RodZ